MYTVLIIKGLGVYVRLIRYAEQKLMHGRVIVASGRKDDRHHRLCCSASLLKFRLLPLLLPAPPARCSICCARRGHAPPLCASETRGLLGFGVARGPGQCLFHPSSTWDIRYQGCTSSGTSSRSTSLAAKCKAPARHRCAETVRKCTRSERQDRGTESNSSLASHRRSSPPQRNGETISHDFW